MSDPGHFSPEVGPSPRPRVVAGVDGSPASVAVVEAAYGEALRRGAVLEIVHVWSFPVYVTGFAPPVPMPPEVYSNAAAEAKAVLDRALAHMPAGSDVPVTGKLVEGHPSRVLIDYSNGAELLVVGRRGHSRIAELLIGSTSRACVEHAKCAVLVVPPSTDHERRSEDATPAMAGEATAASPAGTSTPGPDRPT
jgi:nucleotide-binding universal stress UspA family protein